MQVSMATLRAATTQSLCPLGCLEGQRAPRTEVSWDLLHIPRDYPSTFPQLKARHTIKLTQLRAKPLATEGKAQVSLQPATLIAKMPHCTLELHGSEDNPRWTKIRNCMLGHKNWVNIHLLHVLSQEFAWDFLADYKSLHVALAATMLRASHTIQGNKFARAQDNPKAELHGPQHVRAYWLHDLQNPQTSLHISLACPTNCAAQLRNSVGVLASTSIKSHVNWT